ncbi:helix-turn-helix domain-containing protein [Agrobacterium sp. S2]|nr:helix-turn-helix domain-containing protein [Agrobacterium sp. S2]
MLAMASASYSSRGSSPSPGLPMGVVRRRAITFHASGSEIYAQGEKSGSLYRIESGAVRIYRLLTDGRRQVVAFHVQGETFGFEAWGCRSFYAEAIVPTGLTSIEAEGSEIHRGDLMALALRSMIRAQEHLLVVGRQSALEKLAVFLVDLDRRQGDVGIIDLPMTRTDIGDYLGMTVETVSRSMSRLREKGIVRLKNARCIEILRRDKLQAISE